MNWSRPEDLKRQVRRWWDKGELLGALAGAACAFPRRLVLKGPTSRELIHEYQEARLWGVALQKMPHVRITLVNLKHRVLGNNPIPDEAWVDDLPCAIALLGMQQEAGIFMELVRHTELTQPDLMPWVRQNPLKALQFQEQWPQLLQIIQWMREHPAPGIYLRQIDIPGIHTKFVESHLGLLGELLEQVLPPSAIVQGASGVKQFARRFGFMEKPSRIRFRPLDPSLTQTLPHLMLGEEGVGLPDITLDEASFAKLSLKVKTVFITENEINFLAFPPVAESLVLFGAGYCWESLSKAKWLHDCKIYYWGDIDTHGYAILDQLRAYFPHVESILMDEATLQQHLSAIVEEPAPTANALARLHPAESQVYQGLCLNHYGTRVRLEQERISFSCLQQALAQLSATRTQDLPNAA